MFGQFPGQQQTHGGLDLSRCDGGALVVVSETRRFTGDALEDVVDERVHDPHRLRRDAGVRMNLLHHFVDVDSVALLPGLSALLSSFNGGFSNSLLGAFLRSRLCWFRHDDDDDADESLLLRAEQTNLWPMLIFKEIRSLLIVCFCRPIPQTRM